MDYILYHLDKRNMRAWLYKAGTLKRLNNDAGYKECADNARRFNREHVNFVDVFLEKMRSEFWLIRLLDLYWMEITKKNIFYVSIYLYTKYD